MDRDPERFEQRGLWDDLPLGVKLALVFVGVSLFWVVFWYCILLAVTLFGGSRFLRSDAGWIFTLLVMFVPVGYLALALSLLGLGIAHTSKKLKTIAVAILAAMVLAFVALWWVILSL